VRIGELMLSGIQCNVWVNNAFDLAREIMCKVSELGFGLSMGKSAIVVVVNVGRFWLFCCCSLIMRWLMLVAWRVGSIDVVCGRFCSVCWWEE
jgi:hypothetical protein